MCLIAVVFIYLITVEKYTLILLFRIFFFKCVNSNVIIFKITDNETNVMPIKTDKRYKLYLKKTKQYDVTM